MLELAAAFSVPGGPAQQTCDPSGHERVQGLPALLRVT